MDEKTVQDLLDGALETATVGFLQAFVASYFDAHTIEVKIGRNQILHIREVHPNMFPNDILHLKAAIRRGLLVQEFKRIKHLSCCYQNPTSPERRYIAGLKFAAGFHELWVSTFHRAKERQTRAILKRSKSILRLHL